MSIFTHPIFGIVVGALVTWVVARYYYVAAGKELVDETKKLQALTTIALRALEAGGIYNLARDPAGNIVGLAHTATGNLVVSAATMSGTGQVTKADEKL